MEGVAQPQHKYIRIFILRVRLKLSPKPFRLKALRYRVIVDVVN